MKNESKYIDAARFSPTESQIVTANGFFDAAAMKALQAIAEAKIAHDNVVPLPHTNEDGEAVKHGANKVMLRIRDAYIEIAREWLRHVTDRIDEDRVRDAARAAGFRL